MGDVFDQALAEKPAGDVFDQAVAQHAAQITPPSVHPPQNPILQASGHEDLLGDPGTGFSARTGYRIGQNVTAPAKLIQQFPVIAQQLATPNADNSMSAHLSRILGAIQHTGSQLYSQYRDPANIAGDLVTAGMTMGNAEVPANAPVRAAGPAAAPTAADATLQQVLTKIGKRHIPVVGRAYRAMDDVNEVMNVIKGSRDATPPAPTPPPVPSEWGKGVYGTPVDQWGKRIPTAMPKSVEELQQMIQQQQAGTPVQVGKLPKATADPYAGRISPPMQSMPSGQHSLAGYHPESQTMVIQFKNGKVYDYKGVPPEIYQQYQDAESHGSFFAQNIKGRYQTSYRGSVGAKK